MTRGLALALALSCAGCDVAAPLVDHVTPARTHEDGYIVGCHRPRACGANDALFEPTRTHLRSLDGGSWRGERMELRAREPREVVLAGGRLVDVRIDLFGPVTLRIDGPAELEGVAIASASEDSRLVLDEVRTHGLTLGDAAEPFRGRLEARHSSFHDASLNVEAIELDSAGFDTSIVVAGAMTARDALFYDVVLELGTALLAPADLELVEIRRCEALSLLGSVTWQTRIAACSGEATRIFASTIVHTDIDGAVDADSSELEAVRFGREAPTSLTLWATTLMRCNFCDLADGVLIEGHGATCSDCTEGAFDDRLCKLPQPNVDGPPRVSTANFCDALNMLEDCPADIPDRRRP